MFQPPSESGNVVDPQVLAARRARRAEVSEDASLELRLFEAERRLGEVAAERDALRARIEGLERDLRGTRQREWAEQQQRLEAQGETAAARDLAGAQLAELRERLAEAEAEVAVVAAERDRARRALEDERLRATAERERLEALEREGVLLRAEIARHEGLTAAAAEAVDAARRELAASASASAGTAGLERRILAEREALAARVVAVEHAVSAVRERLATAATTLRERLDGEREARLAAESALGAERAARVAADGAAAEARDRLSSLERERGSFEASLGAERVRAVELERERDAVRVELLAAQARVAELEREVAAGRAQAGELERAVAAERERSAELARATARVAELEREAAAERARSADLARATARVGELEAELARLDPARVDALERELATVSAELAAVREGDEERIARLTERVEAVVALATSLRDGAGEHEALAASLTAMRDRVTELQEGLAATAGLREELEVERAARWVAEAELDAERRRGDEDRAARLTAEERLADVEAELSELRALHRPDPSTLASLRTALDDLRTRADAGETATDAPALGLDLAAAAARLRAATAAAEAEPAVSDHEPAHETHADDEVAPEATASADITPEPLADAEISPAASAAAVLAAPSTSHDDPFAPTAAAPQPDHDAAVEVSAPVVLRRPLPERAPVGKPGPWLRDALQGLAADEPALAETLFVALLPAQAGSIKGSVAYELAVEGGTTHRVVVDAHRARVELPSAGTVDARVSGPLAALVPLAAGGAGRRLPGSRIEGRRRVRKLLKARRAPVGLAELVGAGIEPSPRLLLSVLARAVEPRWTVDRPLTVEFAPEDDDRWRVVADGRGPLAVLPGEGAPPAPAILHTSAGRLPAVLAGTAGADDAYVTGDPRAVRTLLAWLDRAQRA